MAGKNLLKTGKRKKPRAAPIIRRGGKLAEPNWNEVDLNDGQAVHRRRQYIRAWYYENYKHKDLIPYVWEWMKANKYSKNDIQAAKNAGRLADTTTVGIIARMETMGAPYHNKAEAAYWISLPGTSNTFYEARDWLTNRISEAIAYGKTVIVEKKAEEDSKPVAVRKTPQELLREKVYNTVMEDVDTLEDEWIQGKKTTIDLYNLFLKYDLKGAAVEIVRKFIDGWHLDYYDAYHKKCEQAVEGYSHLKRPELKRRLKACDDMIADLDKLKARAKATRKVRTPKARSNDSQIKYLKFCKESREYKLLSINPLTVPGAMRLYTFNQKTRTLSEYVSYSTTGFEVKGTTLQKFDEGLSRSVRLRTPEDFLPIILGKTPKQIDNAWAKLTTKTAKPNGRINAETLLLRVMDK